MAAKKTTSKTTKPKSKAYAPVPKGYKGNWNVPKGTPWKKNSPYNPANSPSVKKVTAKKSSKKVVPAKKAAPAKKAVPAKKASTRGYEGLTAYQKALSVPASKRSAVSKGKLKPYDAKWAANAKKEGKITRADKIAEGILSMTPLTAIGYGFEAVTGKSASGPLNKPAKKANRLSSAANMALAITPFAGAKKIKKTVQTVRGIQGAGKMLGSQAQTAKHGGKAMYDNYVNQLVSKEIARIKREAAKGKKGKK